MSIVPTTPDPALVDTDIPDRYISASQPGIPSPDVTNAFESGLVQVVRRIEIYETDGETLWNPTTVEDQAYFARIVDGSITVDGNADERRVLDLTLDNSDDSLHPDPDGGFWYDKIIKVYRGITYFGGQTAPKAAIIDSPSYASAKDFQGFLESLGYTEIDILLDASTLAELSGYGSIWSFRGAGTASTKLDLMNDLWANGAQVYTIGTANAAANMPHYFSDEEVTTSVTWHLKPTVTDSPVVGSFTATTSGSGTGRVPTAVKTGVLTLALGQHPTSGADTIAAALATHTNGGFWTDVHVPSRTPTQTKNLLRAISNWNRGVGLLVRWETQMGEFMIDGLNWAHFPDQIKVTGRDYVKKLKNSKLAIPSTFPKGTKLRDLVIALAVNAGINANRMRVGIDRDAVLSNDMTYDVGTERYQIIKEACVSFNYEVFFDAFGWFVVRKYGDPYASPSTWTFKTGLDGNLVTFDKSLSDSEIYNHIVVTSAPGDEDRLPFYAEAKNENPNSMTNIERLGDRVLPVQADHLGTEEECKQLAVDLLKIHALEQYAMNKSSIYYPWMEAGEIVEILDPDALDHEPTKYLMDSLNFPMGLGPMSGTAKRITLVGDSGTPPDLEHVPVDDEGRLTESGIKGPSRYTDN